MSDQVKRETSPAFLMTERNRKNAQHSTGPRSEKGKRRVSRNAIKHGLLAKEIIISGVGFCESQGDFSRLYHKLIDDLQPVGTLEEMLVEKIAISYWRLRRVLGAEAGEVRKQLVQVKEDLQKWGGFGSGDNCQSIQHIKSLVEEADMTLSVLKMNDGLTTQGLAYIKSRFGAEQEQIAFWCNLISRKLTDYDDDDNICPQTVEELFLELTGMINSLKTQLQMKLVYLQAQDLEKRKAELLCHTLLGSGALERVLKYETAIERQLYRAINELERLQRMRMGDNVLPPITVDITGEK